MNDRETRIFCLLPVHAIINLSTVFICIGMCAIKFPFQTKFMKECVLENEGWNIIIQCFERLRTEAYTHSSTHTHIRTNAHPYSHRHTHNINAFLCAKTDFVCVSVCAFLPTLFCICFCIYQILDFLMRK